MRWWMHKVIDAMGHEWSHLFIIMYLFLSVVFHLGEFLFVLIFCYLSFNLSFISAWFSPLGISHFGSSWGSRLLTESQEPDSHPPQFCPKVDKCDLVLAPGFWIVSKWHGDMGMAHGGGWGVTWGFVDARVFMLQDHNSDFAAWPIRMAFKLPKAAWDPNILPPNPSLFKMAAVISNCFQPRTLTDGMSEWLN